MRIACTKTRPLLNRLKTLKQTAKLCGWWQVTRLLAAKILGKKSIAIKTRDLEYPVELRLNNSDLVNFLETFFHGDSDLMGRLNPLTIFDLGANIGITALQFHRQFPLAKIVAVEPDPGNFRQLKKTPKGFATSFLFGVWQAICRPISSKPTKKIWPWLFNLFPPHLLLGKRFPDSPLPT